MFLKNSTPTLPGVTSSRKEAIPTVITRDLHILGNIVSDGNIDFDGTLDGNIRANTFKTVLGDVKFGKGGEWAQSRVLQVQFLNIKGNDVVKEAAELLKASPLNFVGNVEGDDIYKGTTDVVVCDGFVGNVLLKTSEGLAQMLYEFLKAEFTRNVLTKLAAAVVYPVLMSFRSRIDPRRYNGATLVGLKGVVVKSHGGADILAFTNALKRACAEVEHGVLDRNAQRIAETPAHRSGLNPDATGPLRAHA